MITVCPACKKSILVPEPGLHSCPRCEARIWINPPDSGKEDAVVVKPETVRIQREDEVGPAWVQEARALAMADPGSRPAPWDERETRGFWSGLWKTWKQVMLFPGPFFHAMKTDGRFGGPLLYGWIMSTVGFLFWATYRITFLPYILPPDQAQSVGSALADELVMARLALLVLVASPILSLLNLAFSAVAYHVVLKLTNEHIGSWKATWRTVCYASSPMLLMAVPFFGDFLSMFWSMTTGIVALARVHRVPTWRAILAYLIPSLLFYIVMLLTARWGSDDWATQLFSLLQ